MIVFYYMLSVIKLLRAGNALGASLQSFVVGGVVIGSAAYIKGSRLSGDISLGDFTKIYCSNISGRVDVGRFTSIYGPNVGIHAKINKITIGSFCSIASNVQIIEYNHKLNAPTTYYYNQNILRGKVVDDLDSKGDIKIGNDVWVGANAVILSGVNVGDGAVICAGSVVVKDVQPYSIVGGNPASHIKFRHDAKTIEKFQKMKWWDWSVDKLESSRGFFNGSE